MTLTSHDRAKVAAELIAAEKAWAEEVDRRVQRVTAEGSKGDDWQTVHERIANRLRSK